MLSRVLMVNPDSECYKYVTQAIQPNMELIWVTTANEALEKIQKESFQLLLLDVHLPDKNGIEFCHTIQLDHPYLPVFFLSNQNELSQKVLSFCAGAEDFITLQMNPLEIAARVDAKIKRSETCIKNQDTIRWKELEIDKLSQEVRVKNHDQILTVDLTMIEYKLLLLLAKNDGIVITRDTILNSIWGEDIHIYSRSVDTHISKLRKKLGNASHLIKSIHGAGYKFNATQI